VTSKEDVSFLWADTDLPGMYKMIDATRWSIEEIYNPLHETAYVIFPPKIKSINDIEIILCPDELFDHESFVAEVLCNNEKFIKYISCKNEYGLLGYFYSGKSSFCRMVELFREKPEYLIEYYDYAHKKRSKPKFYRDFYKYCAAQLLKSEDWFEWEVKKIL
jgi:hypothetical protein